VADTPVDLVVVSVAHFEALTRDAPEVKLALLENLASGAYGQMAAVVKTLGRFDIGI
jgi:glutaminase